MGEFLTSVVAVLFVLGVMMFVHELGHFMAARYFGVRVEVFSFFGLGPRIWGFKRGDTDYRISAIPVGAYVLMAGEKPGEEHSGDPGEFQEKPRWQRAIILVAGPAMNILLAILLVAGILWFVGRPQAAYLTRTAEITALPKDSLAESAGMKPGDQIVEVNGHAVKNWGDVEKEFVQVKAGEKLRMTVERAGAKTPFEVQVPEPPDPTKVFGYPYIPAKVDQVMPGRPAERAGLKADDELLAINGVAVRTWLQFTEAIRGSNGQVVHLRVRRGVDELSISMRPELGQNPRGDKVYVIGVLPAEDVIYFRVGPIDAVGDAVIANLLFSREILRVVGQLFTGRQSLRNLQSVIGIARESGEAAKRGTLRLVQLMAGISLNLGILNLLPIPILDGGHLLILSIEGVRRRDLSMVVKERVAQLAMVFLAAVFLLVMWYDVGRLWPRR